MNIADGLKTLGDFKRLSELLSKEGAEQRWTLVQQWLVDHPKYRKKLYHCLSLTPAEAVPYLCKELNLDYDGLRILDPGGQMLVMAQNTISKLQQLYRDRAAADVEALLTEGAPEPIRKKERSR